MYLKVYACALCRITGVVIVQSITIFAALDCITRDEIIVRPYDGAPLGRSELTIALGQSRIQRWFWALISKEFFLAKRTIHQVLLVYRVPSDPPLHGLSFETIILCDPAYATGSFNAYVDTNRDYATSFTESSTGPIIGDVPVSKGRVLGGSIYAQVTTGAKWRAHAKALHAKATELEATLTTREAHMQEETA